MRGASGQSAAAILPRRAKDRNELGPHKLGTAHSKQERSITEGKDRYQMIGLYYLEGEVCDEQKACEHKDCTAADVDQTKNFVYAI